jgi:hypothetical protein
MRQYGAGDHAHICDSTSLSCKPLLLTNVCEDLIFDHAYAIDVTPEVVAALLEQWCVKHERRVAPQDDVTVQQERLLEPTRVRAGARAIGVSNTAVFFAVKAPECWLNIGRNASLNLPVCACKGMRQACN